MDGHTSIEWTGYFRYRAELRGFDLDRLEQILRRSSERYFDTITFRSIVVGKHDNMLVMIAYEQNDNIAIPVTVHDTTRGQIRLRLTNERFIYG